MIYQALVNQHLASARLILAEGTRQENTAHSLQRAFEHSALHALNGAYLCQLRVIADNYHCGDIAAPYEPSHMIRSLLSESS